jgi:hypothetical protein
VLLITGMPTMLLTRRRPGWSANSMMAYHIGASTSAFQRWWLMV